MKEVCERLGILSKSNKLWEGTGKGTSYHDRGRRGILYDFQGGSMKVLDFAGRATVLLAYRYLTARNEDGMKGRQI